MQNCVELSWLVNSKNCTQNIVGALSVYRVQRIDMSTYIIAWIKYPFYAARHRRTRKFR